MNDLLATRCVECGEVHFPALDPCPSCWSMTTSLALSPHVVLETYTVVYRGGADEVPYALGIGAFPEGVRAFARIAADDFDSLHVGQRLSVLARQDGRDSSFVFSPTGGA
jgi:uncharacterized OB-fold protein